MLWKAKPEIEWQALVQRAMRTDHSWDKSAHDYVALYEAALLDRREDESAQAV